MLSITITDLRTKIRKLADLVSFKGERVRVERNGETAFVLVSEEDAKLLEALEDKKDLKAAKKALKENYTISLDDLEKDLGLK
ncbi:MAG: type II toxin-antitoxin system Phd/YefM family antitoxin [Deltaproteobacteria bacterium]|nr:type II toxin-antitoxin system Phd/YefM family antitoxin [Deltaproteobacteria bacterium]